MPLTPAEYRFRFNHIPPPHVDVESAATLSPCGEYRYFLSRKWDPKFGFLAFIMLNPSTADALVDDPTVKSCMRIAAASNFGGIVVVNLFALRSTDPKALLAHPDPIGPWNDKFINRLLVEPQCDTIVAAWGASAGTLARPRAQEIRLRLEAAGVKPHHLGLTKHGHPRHPLFVARATSLTPWNELG